MAALTLLDLASTTLRYQAGDFADNIYRQNVLTAYLDETGRRTMEEGGLTMDESIAYAKNATFNSLSGYDQISVDPQTEVTAASFPWREVAGSITISKREMNINRGKPQIKRLIEVKRQNAIRSSGSILEDMLFADGTGNGSKNPIGLLAIAPQDPTNDTLGGITSSDNTFWRSKQLNDADSSFASGADTAVSFATNGYRLMQQMYVACSKGPSMETPTFVLTDSSTFHRYERVMSDKVRYTDVTRANLGFTGLQFKAATVTWTDRIGATAKTLAADGYQVTFPAAGVMFFLNTNHLYLRVLEDWNVGDFIEPINQRAYAAKVGWQGQFTTDARRFQGSIFHFID